MKLHEQIEIHLLLQSRSSVYLCPLLLPGPSSRPPVVSIQTDPDFQRLQQPFVASCSSLLQPASAWGYYPRLASWACESQLRDLRAFVPAKIPSLLPSFIRPRAGGQRTSSTVTSYKANYWEMSFPSFFGGLFSELIPGGDCSNIEQDPNADPFDK